MWHEIIYNQKNGQKIKQEEGAAKNHLDKSYYN